MKIYTKTGDTGETSLFGGERVSKSHLRVATYGTLDELNSALGLALSFSKDTAVKAWLEAVQKDLFALGAWLASPTASQNIVDGKDAFTGEKRHERTSLNEERIIEIEKQIDAWESKLTPMKSFILPGGSVPGASLHVARSICRRAEREVVALHLSGAVVPEYVIRYLNRLADAIFVLARYVNHQEGVAETVWT